MPPCRRLTQNSRTNYNRFRNRMTITKFQQELIDADRDLYSGLIRLHVMHHAIEEPIFGLGMIEELARQGGPAGHGRDPRWLRLERRKVESYNA